VEPVYLFAIAGLLLLVAEFLAGLETPFGWLSTGDDFARLVVGVIAGLGGWGLFWYLMKKHPFDAKLFLAVIAPLVVAAAIAAWRLWEEEERLAPLLWGILPLIAVSVWAARGGSSAGAATALLVPGAAMVAGTAWYFSAWSDPRLQIRISEMVSIGGSMGAIGNIAEQAGLQGDEKKREEMRALVQSSARVLAPRHMGFLLLRGIFVVAAVAVSFYVPYAAPEWGWTGAVVGPCVLIPALVSWARGLKLRFVRTLFLTGFGALLYDLMAIAVIAFFAGQVIWVMQIFPK
jgi:hypothetical protein